MSEYNSLYIKVKIREEKLQQFFQKKPVPQNLDENWLEWWNSRKMYGKQPLEQIPYYHGQNNREIFNQLLSNLDFGSVERYDTATENWTFISVFFSENYTEILPMLSLLKQLAMYQETEEIGVAFIYDYCWDCNQVMAYLEFANQQALLKSYISPTKIDPTILDEANRTLEAAIEKFNQQFGG